MWPPQILNGLYWIILKVGYIANLHNVAYEGEDDLIAPFMTEAQSEFNQFREDTLKPEEKLTFATICGDFNFDNMSPSEFLFSFLHIILGSKCESKI